MAASDINRARLREAYRYGNLRESKALCQHLVTQVQHGLLHLELESGCDETHCLDCGEIIAAGPCECPGALASSLDS